MRVADAAEANRVVADCLTAIAAMERTAEEIAEEREWLSHQEPSDENERHAGIEATFARYRHLDAIPEHDRMSAEENERRDLEPDAALARYPRLLVLLAIPEKERRRRTDAEERELRELAEWLPRSLGPNVVKSINPRLAGPVFTAVRAKSTAAPRAARHATPRPRERRVVRRARARSPGRPDDDADLAHGLAGVIAERGPTSANWLAVAVGRRKADVLAALHARPFVQIGKGRAACWQLLAPVRTFDAREAAERWECDVATATEIIFGTPPSSTTTSPASWSPTRGHGPHSTP